MRSPRGLGVSRIGALTMSLALGLSALAAPALAGHHLAGESTAGEAKPGKTLRVSPEDHVMLRDGSRVLNVDICNADGEDCKPANKAKVTVKPRNGLKVVPKKGAQIKVTGNKADTYTLTFKQGNARTTTTVTINEPPNREPQQPTGDMPRLYVLPGEQMLRVGQFAGFETVGCTLVEGGRFGPNGVADGVDDECAPVDIVDIDLAGLPEIEIIGPVGSRFGLRASQFPESAEGPFLFVGPQVVTGIGSTVASASLEDAPVDPATPADLPAGGSVITPFGDATALLAEFDASGRPLGDANGNGTSDDEDPTHALTAFTLGIYDAALDYDADGDLDLDDWEAGGWGAEMPTPMDPFGALTDS